MPTWVEAVLSVLVDPRTISLAALVLALLSFRRTSRLTSLQTRIAELELKNKERIEAGKNRASIRARFYGDRFTGDYRVSPISTTAASCAGSNLEFAMQDGNNTESA